MDFSKILSNLNDKKTTGTPIVLLCCGSFSPVTILHLRMFEMARDYFNKESDGKYEVVGGVLSPVSDGYHKSGLIAAKHRVEMCKLACKDHPFLTVSTWESDQSEWTPTLQVLEKLKNVIEIDCDLLRARIQVFLLAGSDLFHSMLHDTKIWNPCDVGNIVKYFGLVVIERRGVLDFTLSTNTNNDNLMIFESDLLYKNRRNIFTISQPVLTELSSSKIRLLISRGYSVKYLILDSVIEYIKINKLYN